MNSSKIKSIQLIIVVIVLGAAIIYFSSMKTGDDAMLDPNKIDYTDVANINENIETLAITKTYEDGMHTFSGVLTVPTPCHEIETEALVAESFPEQVEVRINVVDTQGVCAQVLTDKPYEVSFQASELAKIRGYVNDVPVEFVE